MRAGQSQSGFGGLFIIGHVDIVQSSRVNEGSRTIADVGVQLVVSWLPAIKRHGQLGLRNAASPKNFQGRILVNGYSNRISLDVASTVSGVVSLHVIGQARFPVCVLPR